MEIKRINFLDGLRGIAILLVILYHAYARWSEIVPYGNKFGTITLFKYGYLGVQLFFLISGFVILMSLEKSKNFYFFIYKRWIRLFPAMLIATIMIYSTSTILFERPQGNPDFKSIIPGLIFIDPNWIKFITGYNINIIENVFWTLFIEVKFYFIFGLLYFVFRKIKAIIGLIILYLLCLITMKFHIKYVEPICLYLSFNYFCWFAIGALSYIFYSSKRIKYLLFAIAIGLIEIYLHRKEEQFLYFTLCIIIIFLLFFTPIYFEKLRLIISNKFLCFFGFISYPLYLIHENAMISLIIKLNKIFPTIPGFLLPIIPITLLCFIAYFIAKKIEPLLRKVIVKICTYAIIKLAKISI